MASPARTLRFGFLRRFIALGFQPRVLIFRKNTLRFLEKRLPAFFRATRFHAFRLPRFDLCLLIGGQIQTRDAFLAQHAMSPDLSLANTGDVINIAAVTTLIPIILTMVTD